MAIAGRIDLHYCALSIAPISRIFRLQIFRRTFSFTDNSSCSRTCSRLDSTHLYCASCNANLCSSVCRCTSPMHFLRDSTWSSSFASSDLAWLSKWSLLPSRKDPHKFDGLAFLNTELLIRFPCSDENSALGFSKAFWPSMNETSKLTMRLETIVHIPLSPARPLHRVSPKLSGHTVVKSVEKFVRRFPSLCRLSHQSGSSG